MDSQGTDSPQRSPARQLDLFLQPARKLESDHHARNMARRRNPGRRGNGPGRRRRGRMSLLWLVQTVLLALFVAAITTVVVGLAANAGRMALNDAILLGNAISVAIGLAIGRWRTRLEGRMDEERVRLVR